MRPTPHAATAVVLLVGLAVPASARADSNDPDPWWAPDKALHFGASAAIAAGGYGIATQIWDDVGPRIAFGAGVALAAGAAKEAADAAGLGHPSWRDFTWDILGTAVGVGLALSIDLATRTEQPAAVR